MITQADILNAVTRVLKEKTGYKVYDHNVIEGFKGPGFFTDVINKSVRPMNKSTLEIEDECEIIFFPPIKSGERIRDVSLVYRMMCEVPVFFIPNVKVKDRCLVTSDFSVSFAGENSDLAAIRFTINRFDTPDDEAKVNEIIEKISFKESE